MWIRKSKTWSPLQLLECLYVRAILSGMRELCITAVYHFVPVLSVMVWHACWVWIYVWSHWCCNVLSNKNPCGIVCIYIAADESEKMIPLTRPFEHAHLCNCCLSPVTAVSVCLSPVTAVSVDNWLCQLTMPTDWPFDSCCCCTDLGQKDMHMLLPAT